MKPVILQVDLWAPIWVISVIVLAIHGKVDWYVAGLLLASKLSLTYKRNFHS